MNSIKLTPAQLWLVHTLEALFMAAIVAGTVAGYQSVATGNYGLASIGGIMLAAIVAVLSRGASTSILNNANLLPALLDTAKDIQSVVNAQAIAQPPVIIHNHLPAQPTPVPVQVGLQGSNAPSSVQPIPAPVAPVQPVQQVQQVPFPPVARSWGDTGIVPTVQPGTQP